MTDLPVDVAAWLAGPGTELVAAATGALDDGGTVLSVGTLLRRRGVDPGRAAAATAAAEGRLRARELGYPGSDRLLLTRASLEQASHPAVARHRVGRFPADGRVLDLCAGVGLDAMALAGRGPAPVVAVDRDLSRCILLDHNARAADVPVWAVCADVLAPPVAVGGLVHADPSRRHGGRRARRLGEYGPPVGALLAATGDAAGRAVVVSPAVSWNDPDLPAGAEIEFVQVGSELKEATLWSGALRRPGQRATAVLLPSGAALSRGADPEERLGVGPVGEWLVEVAPAAVRARLHERIGREVGASRIAARRALLTTGSAPPASPWYRVSRVEAVLRVSAGPLRAWFTDHADQPVEILLHGLDGDPLEWWRRIGRPQRGPNGRRLHLVRTDDGAIAVVTTG